MSETRPTEDRILRIVECGLNRQILLIRRIAILIGIVAVLQVLKIGMDLYWLAHIQH